MNHRKLPKPPLVWTDQTDLALRILHENKFTFSGIAKELGCARLEAVERATELGILSPPVSRSKADVLQARGKGRAA